MEGYIQNGTSHFFQMEMAPCSDARCWEFPFLKLSKASPEDNGVVLETYTLLKAV